MVHSNGANVFCFMSSLPSSPPVTTAVFGSYLSSLFILTHRVIAGADLLIHMIGEQGVTKRCRLSLLTNSALVIRAQMRGEGRSFGVSVQINFGDLPPYLTYVGEVSWELKRRRAWASFIISGSRAFWGAKSWCAKRSPTELLYIRTSHETMGWD